MLSSPPAKACRAQPFSNLSWRETLTLLCEREISLKNHRREFERVRALIRRPGRAQSQRHAFAFTGMIRCGTCGLAVTAAHKYKPSGLHYQYKAALTRSGCAEPSAEARSLEGQLERFVGSLAIDPAIEAWVQEEITCDAATLLQEREARRRLLESSRRSAEEQLGELTSLRIRSR